MEERNLSSWEEFEKALKDIRDEHEQSDVQLKSSSLLFRGEENSSWSLMTTLDRKRERMLFKDYYGIITRIRPQIETLTGSEWPIPDYPQVRKDVEDYDKFSMELWCGRCPGYPYMAYLRVYEPLAAFPAGERAEWEAWLRRNPEPKTLAEATAMLTADATANFKKAMG